MSFDNGGAYGAIKQLQADNYYAFGTDVPVGAIPPGRNYYLYNKKELQDELTEYDYGARFYDPVIGRWTSVDPLAGKGRRWSPYVYGFNDPIRFEDPDGMWPWPSMADIKKGYSAIVASVMIAILSILVWIVFILKSLPA